ncbi:hypothetical protein COU93_01510 [Candidatus Shapirobacteria bacterium CG10_big_fil_rev_8_21_14_0_10_36_6]|uniref:5-hmdU DNA kinase helical domain-containing protein n=1 Tax=Candidatus Shapirobacteria bacterium CG10_big_fil_rev_8_21_14_0_10_36_6 TaxID=1974886 RepID=A0A2M8L1Z5_9BACT|nr:MAG: hypothetical protein COU93_01510 [Candidatus Shapirobacteria bacterium CG10_big_fil_rev_8_21_14_0_10_36_6]
MEVPDNLKYLYKHWEKHTQKPEHIKKISADKKVLEKIIWLVNERMGIFEKKQKGEKPPFTKDEILSTYRFCNVYRELDRQTIFFHTLLKPLEKDFSLWFLNMLFCRSICRTETIERIGLLNFDVENNKKVFKRLIESPSPKYGNAYIFPISTIQKSKWNTREKFFCLYYPIGAKNLVKEIEQFDKFSVVEALKKLLPVFGFNMKFLMTEVLIDVAYQCPQHIDLFKQFPIGPGSIPTMKSLNKINDPEIVNLELSQQIYPQINYLTFNEKSVYLSAENWEGIGCEFRKYTNLSNGKGRKRLYKSQRDCFTKPRNDVFYGII